MFSQLIKITAFISVLVMQSASLTFAATGNDQKLLNAAGIGNSAEVQNLLKSGAYIDVIGRDGDTPLERALHIVDEKSFEQKNPKRAAKYTTIKLLLDNGAKIRGEALTAVCYGEPAFDSSGDVEILRLMLNKGANINSVVTDTISSQGVPTKKSLLSYYLRQQCYPHASVLLKADADVKLKSATVQPIDALGELFRGVKTRYDLISNSFFNLTKELLEKGADVEGYGVFDSVEYSSDETWDPKKAISLLNVVVNGISSENFAISKRLIELLISKGARIDIKIIKSLEKRQEVLSRRNKGGGEILVGISTLLKSSYAASGQGNPDNQLQKEADTVALRDALSQTDIERAIYYVKRGANFHEIPYKNGDMTKSSMLSTAIGLACRNPDLYMPVIREMVSRVESNGGWPRLPYENTTQLMLGQCPGLAIEPVLIYLLDSKIPVPTESLEDLLIRASGWEMSKVIEKLVSRGASMANAIQKEFKVDNLKTGVYIAKLCGRPCINDNLIEIVLSKRNRDLAVEFAAICNSSVCNEKISKYDRDTAHTEAAAKIFSARQAKDNQLQALANAKADEAALKRRKQIGDRICLGGTAAFGLVKFVVTGFVEQVSGSRIQIRITDTQGQSAVYRGTELRQNTILWDEFTNWRSCN